jgi:hypothetical protein
MADLEINADKTFCGLFNDAFFSNLTILRPTKGW